LGFPFPLPADAIPAALAVRLLTVAATLCLARRPTACRLIAFGGSVIASAATFLVAGTVVFSGVPAGGSLFRHGVSSAVVTYSVSPLSAWFLLVLGLLAVPIAVYSVGYLAHAVPASRTAFVGAAFNVLIGAIETVFVADDVIGFLFAWELMSLTTTLLVATEHENRASRRSAYLYLVMSHVGTGCLVAGFFILASMSGSLSFATLLSGGLATGRLRDILFLLFFLGFGVKAGVVPLHVWLPEAHPAAPSSISALMSAVLIKAGVYGLFKVCAFGLGTPRMSWGLALMAVGAVSAVLGVLYALQQTDLKRLLAYSTIDNAGIILLSLGSAMTVLASGHGELASVGIAASLYHVLNHAVFKGLLFLGAGSVVMALGTRHIEAMGGLLRRMPWTGLFFLIGAGSIAGLPLLNGFVSEWLAFQSLLLGFQATPGLERLNFPVAGALLALTSALAAACFVKAFGITFLARPRSRAAEGAHEAPAVMLVPQAFLAVLCVLLGLFPGVVLRVLGPVMVGLPGLQPAGEMVRGAVMIAPGPDRFDQVSPAALAAVVLAGVSLAALLGRRAYGGLRRTPTWACGGQLDAQMEYTATAFSKPLMMIFRAVYRPTREVEALAEVSPYFPQEVRFRAEIEPTFERFVYAPLTRGVLRVAEEMKILQAGSLHAYLAYVLALGVVLLIWLGGEQ